MLARKKHRDSQGVSMVQALGIGVVLTAGALGVTSIIDSAHKSSLASRLLSTTTDIKRKIVQTVEDEDAWNRTVNLPENSATLGCLTSTTDPNRCNDSSSGTGSPIKIVDRKGENVFDSLSPTHGFTIAGAGCATYSANGNDHCPLRMEVKVKLICADGASTCDSPQIWIIGNYLPYAPRSKANKSPFNTQKHGFAMQRGGNSLLAGFLLQFCTMIGGTFEPNTKDCSIACVSDKVLGGISNSGANCILPTKVANIGCPDNKLLNGFDAAGNPLCLE